MDLPPKAIEAALTLPTLRESPEPVPYTSTITGVMPQNNTIPLEPTLQPTLRSNSTEQSTSGSENNTTEAIVLDSGTSTQNKHANSPARDHFNPITSSLSQLLTDLLVKGFAPPKKEKSKGSSKGISTSNIIKGKRTRKPAAFSTKGLL